MRALVRALAMLGWSILALFTSFFYLCFMSGIIESLRSVDTDKVGRDQIIDIWLGVAFGIAGITCLLGCFGRLPGTRRAPKGRPPAVRQ